MSSEKIKAGERLGRRERRKGGGGGGGGVRERERQTDRQTDRETSFREIRIERLKYLMQKVRSVPGSTRGKAF